MKFKRQESIGESQTNLAKCLWARLERKLKQQEADKMLSQGESVSGRGMYLNDTKTVFFRIKFSWDPFEVY